MAISKQETIRLRSQLKLARDALKKIMLGDAHDPQTFAERTLDEIEEIDLKSKHPRIFGE